MPRHYKRKIGNRRYVDYSKEQLAECLARIRAKSLTQRAAAELYNIPRSTLKLKLKEVHSKKPGHPTVFSEDEEKAFVAHVTALDEFGFPLTDIDLQFIVRDYLAAQGREVKAFKNNVPGREWVKAFLRRHNSLSKRFANNIKKVKAQISEESIKVFIENISKELDSVPPENIYNYDETNLTDDPGRKKVICRRGSKYPERIVNSTKISFSVMFYGNAAGATVPPYIIYKAEHLWTTWTSNGPDGARYNRTKSGWIDSATFEDWFICHLLPILKKQEGRKVIIGDNLSSHINKNVLSECEKNNISFICLLPNATHILQPLDVAYFRPLKIKWREVLTNWKDSQQGRKLPSTPKELFPSLLKQALNRLTDTSTSLISGFRRSGIYPPNVEEPLKRLPKQDCIVNIELIGDVFLQKLDQLRNGDTKMPNKGLKKKKIDVPAGRSICAKDLLEAGPSSSQSTQKKTQPKPTRKVTKKKTVLFKDSTTDCSDDDISLASSTEDLITAREVLDDSEEDLLLATLKKRGPTNEELTDAKPQSYNEDEAVNDSPVLKLPKPDLQTCNDGNKVSDDLPVLPVLNLSTSDLQTWDDGDAAIDNITVPKLLTPDPLTYEDQGETTSDSTVQQLPTSDSQSCDDRDKRSEDYTVGDYVIVLWNSVAYPGQIISECAEGAMVSCMKKGKKFWRWPVVKDEQLYRWEDVVKKIEVPKFMKKGCFTVPEMDK